MMWVRIVCVFLMVFGRVLVADVASLEQANQWYQDQKYNKALTVYEQLLDQAPLSVPLLYNLGNTQFKLGQLGKAIVSYRRALKWAPLDADIRYNLALARDLVVDDVPEQAAWQKTFFSWVDLLSLMGSVYLVLGGMTLLLGCLWGIKLGRLNREMGMNFVVIVGIVLGVSVGVFFTKWVQHSQKSVVIVDKKVSVHSGPSASFPVLFYIHEGHECRVMKESGQWVELLLSNGFKGWVPGAVSGRI